MISQYQLNNDFVDTTTSAYPSLYIQNQQSAQNQQSGNKNSQEQTTQSSWAEATAASTAQLNQPFLSNNSYILTRQNSTVSDKNRINSKSKFVSFTISWF